MAVTELATHLDDLLAVLRASAELGPLAGAPAHLRRALAARLMPRDQALAAMVRALDDWHVETLADFVAEAHVLARALDRPPDQTEADTETRAD
jgi:hypothetical protein